MNVKKQIQYWLKTAEKDWETAQIIFDAGKNYHHCLFFCHLVLEKGLKANVVKVTGTVPPKIHTFNIEGRYPDMRYQIYKSATKSLTKKLLNKTKEEFQWMENSRGNKNCKTVHSGVEEEQDSSNKSVSVRFIRHGEA